MLQCQRFGEQPGECLQPFGFPTGSRIPETGIAPWLSLEIRHGSLLGGTQKSRRQPALASFAIHLLKRLVKWARGAPGARPRLLTVNGAASSASISPLVTEDTAKSSRTARDRLRIRKPASFCCASAPPAGIPSSPMPVLPACWPAGCLQLVVTA